jgi:hypothetical protein
MDSGRWTKWWKWFSFLKWIWTPSDVCLRLFIILKLFSRLCHWMPSIEEKSRLFQIVIKIFGKCRFHRLKHTSKSVSHRWTPKERIVNVLVKLRVWRPIVMQKKLERFLCFLSILINNFIEEKQPRLFYKWWNKM